MYKRKTPLCLYLSALLVLLGAANQTAHATTVIPLTLEDTLQRSEGIFVGKVINAQSRYADAGHRWIYTDYTFQVEETLAPGEGLPKSGFVTLTYWGGRVGQVSMAIADVSYPQVGQRMVMMLHPDQKIMEGTPVIGMHQGQFLVKTDSVTSQDIVTESEGNPLRMTSDGQVVRSADLPAAVKAQGQKLNKAQSEAGNVTLAQFKTWIRGNFARVKAMPLKQFANAPASDPRVLKPIFLKPEPIEQMPTSRPIYRPEELAKPLTPDFLKKAEQIMMAPVRPNNAQSITVNAQATPGAKGSVSPVAPAMVEDVAADPGQKEYDYSTFGGQNLNIVMNPFPTNGSFSPWSPEDQYCMGKWNYYGDVFRVQAPTGTYGWVNFRNDLAGWLSNSAVNSTYGFSWGSTTLAVCFTWSIGNTIQESDIAFNPAYSWTLDDAWVFSGSSAWPFRATMVHELGHAWGLNHNFTFMSVMNYYQHDYRAMGFVFMDDAEGIRAQYPSRAVARTDSAAYLFRNNGTQNYAEATYPSSVVAGNSMSVGNFWIENVGTTTINPSLNFYLTTNLNYSGNYYFLQTINYSALGRYNYFNPASVGFSTTVPTGVPGGDYYLNIYQVSEGNFTEPGSVFPINNNYAWSHEKIHVYPRLTGLSVSPTTVTGGNSATATLSLGSASDGLYVSTWTSSAYATVPSSVYVYSGNSSASYTVTTSAPPTPRTVTLWSYYQGIYQSAALKLRALSTLSVSAASGAIGDTVTLSAQLARSSDSAALGSQFVYYYIDGVYSGYDITAADGSSSLAYALTEALGPGAHTVAVYFFGDNDYAGSSASTTLNVAAANTTTAVTSVSGAVGETVALTATVTRNTDSGAVAGRTVTFTVGTTVVGTATTDGSGIASLNYVVSGKAGVKTLTAAFSGDTDYNASTGTGTVTVAKADTTLTAPNASGKKGTVVTIKAKLTRNTDNKIVTGRTVTLKVGSTVIGTGVTDATGTYSKSYTIPTTTTLGLYTTTATFAGDTSYNSTSSTGTLRVYTTTTTTVAAVTGKRGTTVTLKATLKTAAGNPLVGRTMNFKVGSNVVGTATTNSSGLATISYAIPATATTGIKIITASFAGETLYSASSGTGNLTVTP